MCTLPQARARWLLRKMRRPARSGRDSNGRNAARGDRRFDRVPALQHRADAFLQAGLSQWPTTAFLAFRCRC